MQIWAQDRKTIVYNPTIIEQQGFQIHAVCYTEAGRVLFFLGRYKDTEEASAIMGLLASNVSYFKMP